MKKSKMLKRIILIIIINLLILGYNTAFASDITNRYKNFDEYSRSICTNGQ